jgi:hypothetical protein
MKKLEGRKMNKIILIYNWKTKKEESFPAYLDKLGVKYRVFDNADDSEHRLTKWHKIINTLECVKLAVDSLRCAKEGDIIVSMCATPGIFAALLNKKKVKILTLNLLCHSSETPGMIEKIRNNIYRKALNKTNVWATCNAREDVLKYRQMFSIGCDGHIVHLPDGIKMDSNCLSEAINLEQDCPIDVFSCGASARDWDTFVKVSERFPNSKFHVIARECDWKSEYNRDNIAVEFNVPHESYIEKLKESTIVFLPLKSQMTAGLLVMFDAVKNGRLVLVTDNESTSQFVPDDLKQFMLVKMGDTFDAARKLKKIFSLSRDERLEIINKEKSYLYENYSEDVYNKRLNAIIEEVKSENL